MIEQDDSPFTRFTYEPTKHEAPWLAECLQELHDDLYFTDILYQARGGKEATVYCCRGHESTGLSLVAAKVFRPRMFRAMKNDWFYKQGRQATGLDGKAIYRGKAMRALRKNARAAQKIHTASWSQHEFTVLQTLFDAGCHVPRPLAHTANALLMEYIGDEAGPAPTLQSVSLPGPLAHETFQRLLDQVRIMLAHRLIHADLSPYNILWWQDRAVIIDLPQAVHADHHPQAFALLHRDIERLVSWFTRQGVQADAMTIAQDFWADHTAGRM